VADLVGQGVRNASGDDLGRGGSIIGLRNDKSENVLNKDILGFDSVVDPDAYLGDRTLFEGCGGETSMLSLTG
jgi:hypothetical protein